MNSSAENIIINSCQYTPVYVIQQPSPRPFVVTQDDEHTQKPVSDTLKNFYENSGKIENNLQESEECKPKISQKIDSSVVGNNLKLANFLLHKIEPSKQYIPPVNNIVIKPVTPPCNTSAVNVIPKLDINSKIVKLKTIPNSPQTSESVKKLPKIKPKENNQNPSKHTSVQLLKLGETYHSLNQLSDEQMKIVNHALKIFSDPEKTPKQPAYDPVTNTRFVYKVLSPKDLTIVGKNKLIFKQKKEKTNYEVKNEGVEEELIIKKKIEKNDIKPVPSEEIPEQSPPAILKTKVTRSGRKVKLPKLHTSEEETLHKPRKKNETMVSCFQCSVEFSSLYRLQRHYENHPTHIPSKIHSNLFHCLLAIIKSGSEEDRANIFIQQLEQLIAKFKSLLPCLLKKVDGDEGKLCNINDDIGRLFGMNPGKYNLNMDALSCVKDKEGHCRHNPPKTTQYNLDIETSSNIWQMNEKEDQPNMETEDEDCARINSVTNWPTVTKRSWKQKAQNNTKKAKLDSECDTSMELNMDDLIRFSEKTAADLQTPNTPCIPMDVSNEPVEDKPINIFNEQTKKPTHVQFHSAHFDIRSSPIKQSSTVFCKFQIDPEKIPKYEVQIIKPNGIESENQIVVQTSEQLDTSAIFNDNIELPSKEVTDSNLDFVNKSWTGAITNDQTDSDIKSSTLIESALLHFKDDSLSKNPENQNDVNWVELNDQSNQNQSEINFFDTLGSDCLTYSETEIRNNHVDFQLDLFPFTNT